jgi:hypothetical protein
MKNFICILLLGLMYGLIFTGCHKDELITDRGAGLSFSTDTVYFDTLLTTLGSTTGHFKIYNEHDQPIEISDLYLAGGSNSFFRLNVDGSQGREFHNIRIESGDSIYVFVALTIDPLDQNNPLIIKDSVVCLTNDNLQHVELIAYGQDVHIYRRKIFKTETWTAEKPYLIEDYAVIDSNEILTIDAGTRIYLTNNSILFVWGKLIANGTPEAPILFTGSRFDAQYENVAGQWGSIFFHQKSTGNKLDHVIIKNAQQGMLVGYPDNDSHTEIELKNCMILNTATIGIYTFNGTINAYNTIVADCGYFALLALMGGTYNFYHCTFSNVSAYYPDGVDENVKRYKYRSYPSIVFSNYADYYDLDIDYRIIDVTYSNDINLNFYNSIIYGTQESEVYFDTIPSAGLNYSFDHCLLKLPDDSLAHFDTTLFISVLRNVDPGFLNDSIALGEYDFQLDSVSPAINAGSPDIINRIPGLEYDFNGNLRTSDGLPDLGAYERYE